MSKSPLIRPILYPKMSDGHGAEYRTSAEIAAINDETKLDINAVTIEASAEQLAEAAGITVEEARFLAGRVQDENKS